MTNDPSAQSASRVMGDIQSTLSHFHKECESWETDIRQLLGDFNALALPAGESSDVLSEISELRRVVSQQSEMVDSLFDQVQQAG